LNVKWKEFRVKHKWRFIVLSLSDCNVELNVEGTNLSPAKVKHHFHIPEAHIQPKFIIGGRYKGFDSKPDSFFKGSLSGLVLTIGHSATSTEANCLANCRERLEVADLPDSLQLQSINGGSMLELEGKATKEDVRAALESLVYDTIESPSETYTREINIRLDNVEKDIYISQTARVQVTRPHSKVSIVGLCQTEHYESGYKICKDIHVKVEGCNQGVEGAEILVDGALTELADVFIATSVLQRFGLQSQSTSTGLKITGSAKSSDYSQLLGHLRLNPKTDASQKSLKGAVMVRVQLGKPSKVLSSDFRINIDIPAHVETTPPTTTINSTPPTTTTTKKATPIFVKSKQVRQLAPVVHDNLLTYNDILGIGSRHPSSSDGKKSHGGSQALAIMGAIFGAFVIVTLAGYGLASYRLKEQANVEAGSKTTQTTPNNSNEYYWDEEGLPVRVIINPTERISILHDPYQEKLKLEQQAQSFFVPIILVRIGWNRLCCFASCFYICLLL
jgi:hypothetical protein